MCKMWEVQILLSVQTFYVISALTCMYPAHPLLFQGKMGAHACKHAVIKLLASKGQQDDSAGEVVWCIACIVFLLFCMCQVTSPVEGSGGKSTGPETEQPQRGVIQSWLHRTGWGVVWWVCRDKIQVTWEWHARSVFHETSGAVKCPMWLSYSQC